MESWLGPLRWSVPHRVHCKHASAHCNTLCMYLRNQQLAVAVASDTPSPFSITNQPQRDIAFNTFHSKAQLFVGIFYIVYPLELICVMISKMLVIDRISLFLKKVCNEGIAVFLCHFRSCVICSFVAGWILICRRSYCAVDAKCYNRVRFRLSVVFVFSVCCFYPLLLTHQRSPP